MNYFRRQSSNTTTILLIKVYTQSNKSIPIINKAAVINSTTTNYNEVTLKSLLRSEISSAQSQSSQSEGVHKNKRRTISITNNSVEVQTNEGTNINALLDLPICNLFDVLNKQQQQQGSSSNSDNNSSSSSYEIVVIVKGHDIDDNNETTTRWNSSSTTRKQNSSPRIVRILIILALLAIVSEIFVPNTTISSTNNDNDASFATPTTTTQHHYKSSQSNHIPTPSNANTKPNNNAKINTSHGNKRQVQIEQCTPSELSLILYQLPNEDCLTYKKQPWRQKCSLTYATKCPDATWLERYYTKLHYNAANQTFSFTSQQQQSKPPTFLAIFIGCNKGYDAVNTLRMGSGNPIFDKDKWRDALTNHGTVQIKNDVCNQASEPQFVLPPGNVVPGEDGGGIRSQVHCIEPLPPTIRELQRAANETNYGKQGLVVVHAAMAREDGVVPFDSGLRNKAGAGVENIGISNSACDDPDNQCVNVTMYSLDTYINKFIPKDMPINYLSVDVEGWDYNVLMGGQQHALERVHYLEFEYNWIGPWKDQSLKDLIELLDTKFGFTCYFAGFDETIWRITGCWLDHYNVHTWSNVACVNRNYDEVYDIAYDMERMYKATIEKGNDGLRDFEHRKQVATNPNV